MEQMYLKCVNEMLLRYKFSVKDKNRDNDLHNLRKNSQNLRNEA